MRRIPLLAALAAGVLAFLPASFALAARSAGNPPANSALPTISGTAKQGQTLTASNGSWSGTAPLSYSYQWQRCDAQGATCGAVSQATAQNYVPSPSDVDRTLRVAVTATNAAGTSQALSAASAAIAAAGSAPANIKQPEPSGTAQDGQTVSVNTGDWTGQQPITFSYQWQSCTALNPVCVDLAGATGQSYTAGTGQIGSLLRATVTATNSLGKNSASSNLTSAVLAKASAPLDTALPLISGGAFVGQTLQVSTGVWTGVAANGYAYQWSRCNANGNGCAGISGATGQSYGVGQADLGLALRATVTATNPTGKTNATSAATLIAVRTLQTASFNAVLRPGQEVRRPHRTSSLAAGHFTAKLKGKTLTWTLSFVHLNGRPGVTTLNKGARATSGAAFKTLCRACRSPEHGTLVLTASQLDAFLRGRAYVNVHTVRNPAGEIRGQVTRLS